MKTINSVVAAVLITIAFGAFAQPKTNPLPTTQPPASTTATTTTLVLDTDAEQIRSQFQNLLERHPPQVGRVLKLPRMKMLRKVIIPATLPYVFTGCRLSLGIAWLVIVASEMLTGAPDVGGFLWQEDNSLVYSHILLSIITMGVIGFLLDRLMGMVERKFKTA